MRGAAEISRLLATQAQRLAADLLPAGRRDGAEWRCGSLAGESGQSLAVHLTGPRAGVWADFASGECGDALDLVAAVLHRGDKRAALAWSRRWLGLDDKPAPAGERHQPPPPAPPPEKAGHDVDAEAEQRRRAALAMFIKARPNLAGTPASDYLAARGIDLAELGRQPRSLRFAPELWNVESQRHWPALVAAVSNAAGEHVATHRTWLAKDEAGIWRKAPLRNPKMSLGSVAGGCIRLWRGASGKSLAQAPEGEEVGIAEGIETALSVVIACPDLRMLASVSLANMHAVPLPPAVRTVILCADRDEDNPGAARALRKAIQAFMRQGRIVKVAWPPHGKDFNDSLREAME